MCANFGSGSAIEQNSKFIELINANEYKITIEKFIFIYSNNTSNQNPIRCGHFETNGMKNAKPIIIERHICPITFDQQNKKSL